MRRGHKLLVSSRGPGCVVGDVRLDSSCPRNSEIYVVARSPVVRVLLVRHDRLAAYGNQPLVRAAITRSHSALLVQEAMERFIECKNEVGRTKQRHRAG